MTLVAQSIPEVGAARASLQPTGVASEVIRKVEVVVDVHSLLADLRISAERAIRYQQAGIHQYVEIELERIKQVADALRPASG